MEKNSKNHKRFFACCSPIPTSQRLNWFEVYAQGFSLITLFEVASFFRGTVYYLIVLFVAPFLFFLQHFHIAEAILLGIGAALFYNKSLPLPDSIKRLSISSIACVRSIHAAQKIPRSSISEKSYIWLTKACSVALFLLSTQIFFSTDIVFSVIALVLIAVGMLLDLYLLTSIGFLVTLYCFT